MNADRQVRNGVSGDDEVVEVEHRGANVQAEADGGAGAGELRENLGTRVLLGRASQNALGMAFADPTDALDAYQSAHGVVADAEEKVTGTAKPGRLVYEMDGIGTGAAQGWFASEEEIVAELRRRDFVTRDDSRPVVHNGAATPDLSVLDNL